MAPKEPPAIAVALTGWNLEHWLERLARAAAGRRIINVRSADEPLPARYYLLCWKADPRLLKRTPAPLLILSAGAGVDHILNHDPPQGVPITRIVEQDLTGRMVEYVVLHCLYHLRHMNEAAANQARAAWRSRDFAAARQVTVGLMGVGEMGQASARGLTALGFNVIGWGRTRRPHLPFRSYAGPGELDEFLSQTDILVSLLPSTHHTQGLIDGAMLCKLRRGGAFLGPVLINAGRGDTANEGELIGALQDGTLRAASIDVFAAEPLARDSPLWGLPNVVITPHNAADSDPDAIIGAVMAEIARFEAGAPLRNPVDRARGY